jgi:tetratricopeptide (TPR) repeat protein
MNEQSLINEFHKRVMSNQSIFDLIPVIEKDYKNSVILHYYLGFYYEKKGAFSEAEEKYLYCIDICPSFANSYLNLGNYYFSVNREKEGENILKVIFDRKTLDTTVAVRTLIYDFNTQIKICSLLGPYYTRINDKKKLIKLYTTVYEKIKVAKGTSEIMMEGWKNICYGLGNIYMEIDPEKSYQYYLDGLSKNSNIHLDRNLMQGAILAKNYCIDPKDIPVDIITKLYPVSQPSSITYVHDKIRIGYLTPDLNKNAVGLFSTVLLKNFNRDKFEVYIYYTNDKEDEFTKVFKSYKDIKWFDVYNYSDIDLYKLINHNHEIDILIDMIAMGVKGKPELIAMKPANIIVNYLGFPDTGYLSAYTHRITDRICDPIERKGYSEKLVYMPRSFICYKLFENIPTPEINYKPNKKKIHIGIFNKSAKQHQFIRNVWKGILQKKKNYILCVKDKELYSDFPQDQIKILPFTNTLQEYYEQMNEIDFCLDTYPYSGTTTTASCLFMGLPVFTIYKPSNPHHSNVSGSLLLNISEDDFVCENVKEYTTKAVNFKVEDNEKRIERRKRFMELMDTEQYMKEYEDLLLNVFSN